MAEESVKTKNDASLSSLASVFTGLRIPGKERNGNDYLIIKPQHIFDYKVHLGNNRKEYCDKKYITTFPDWQKYFLQDGDILVRLTGKPTFGFYEEEGTKAIANANTVVIRPNPENRELLRYFFISTQGVKQFEKNLEKMYAKKFCGLHFSQRDFLAGLDVSEREADSTNSVVEKIKNFVVNLHKIFPHSPTE